MTAEIAVANKLAIALAADSAVTLQMRKGQKIYTTNKLFTLSKYHPVGLMIYGDAELLAVPWETIVKLYRKRLGTNKLKTLKDYYNDFMAFLGRTKNIFSIESYRNFFKQSVGMYFTEIRGEIDEEIKEKTQKTKITEEEINNIIHSAIKKRLNNLKSRKFLPGFSRKDVNVIKRKYLKLIHDLKNDVFVKLPIKNEDMKALQEIAANFFCKDIFRYSVTGIVIAGFGEKELFPHVIDFLVEGIINGKVRHAEPRESKTSDETISIIRTFAQAEMAKTFMEGIDPDFQDIIFGGLKSLLTQIYPEHIADKYGKMSSKDKKNMLEKLKKIGQGFLDKFMNMLVWCV